MIEALSDALPARSSDGELSLLEARAETLSGLDGRAVSASAHAFRELGAARWDLAGDHDGAVRAWARAARRDPDRGVARLARDLVSFAGYADAVVRLTTFAVEERDPKDASRAFAITSMIALSAGEPEAALQLASRALELDPTRADVLAIAERAAARDEDLDVLERIYETLSNASLGCYGERAVHYRAARNLERRGQLDRALRHAVRAFEAVPSEGITFVVMSRLGERVADSSEIVRAISRVASREKEPSARAEWLRRAAAIGGSGEEGARQRVEVLLRALAVQPAVSTVVSLGAAFRQLMGIAPESRDISEMRFTRALHALESRLEGPEGARVGIAAAGVALDTFQSATLAAAVLIRAIDADASVDEYAEIAPREVADAAAELLARIVAAAEDRYGNAGATLLVLGAGLAAQRGDADTEAKLLVAAAQREPEDSDLVRRATVAAQRAGESELVASVIELSPSAARLAELLDLARDAEQRQDLASAIDALEEVLNDDAADADARRVARDKLRELYGRAGRRDELERLLIGDLERADIDPHTRGRITRELAALVAARGDPERALTILSRMATTLPDDIGVLEDTVTLARQAGDKRRRADALGRLVDLVAEEEKLPLLRELAPLLEELRDEDTALARYNEVLARAPRDLDALAALERDAERRGDWERLVELFGRRASIASRVDDVRHIRLRRATVLEQRLGRADDALAELEALVAATGDHLSVLRVLADLNERRGAPLRAAQLWMRASAVTTDRREAAELGLRAAAAHLEGGDVGSARRVLEGLEAWAEPTARFLELRVEVEKKSEDPRALAVALDELASLSPGTAQEKAALLVESARAFERAGDLDEACARAERAAVLAPQDVDAQLVARLLEYKSRGPGSLEEARITITELRSIEDAEMTSEQAALRAFLLAEALDVGVGPGSGMREVSRAEAEAGRTPVIALAIAERLVAGGEPAPSLELFDAALGGDLYGLRARGRVALTAARAAHEAGDTERAQRYVEIAGEDGELRDDAQALSAEIRSQHRPIAEPASLAERAPPKPSPPRGSAPDQPPETKASRSEPPPRAISEIPPPLNRDPRAEPDPLPSSRPPPAVDMPSGEVLRPSRVFPAVNVAEQNLLEQLNAGDVNAGIELMNQLENRSSRTHDLVNVARRVVALVPGDTSLLRRLYEASLSDKNTVYGRALEHALAIFDRSVAPVPPPPLGEQPEDPEPVRTLLFRDVSGSAAEALALVWEGAAHVFRRDPSTYGVTGLERVPLGAPTPLGRIYSAAARSLGVGRTPLFQRRTAGPVTLSVALLSPPAVIVSGEVTRESPALAFHLGAMLAAALPEHVLMFGSPESQTRGVLKGLGLAFGRPTEDRSGLTAIANLAEVLWESIPPRAQRRLRELCDDSLVLDYDAALGSARRSVRRAGLFACGDLATALRETIADEELDESLLDAPDGPTRLCRHEAVADLVRLATSIEYAQVRWHPGRRNRQPSGTWATF
ncbi:MAG: hypothetical protein H6717_04050 [Polyangiaceae bacterium]|nr:hypothetical protein [Polyangiaceae bacterium]